MAQAGPLPGKNYIVNWLTGNPINHSQYEVKTNVKSWITPPHSLGPNTKARQKLRDERNNFLTKMGRGGGKKTHRKRKNQKRKTRRHRK